MKKKSNQGFKFFCFFLIATAAHSWSFNDIEIDLSLYDLPGNNCTYEGEKCICLPEKETEPPSTDPPLFELLEDGYEVIKNYSIVKNSVILLGNTGAGKTTAAQILAGDLSRLHAALDQAKRLVIIDEDDKIGLPSKKSKTLLPDQFLRELPDDMVLPFYDFPGFDDTRGHIYDIAANYFMYEMVNKIPTLKMFFLVVQSSLYGDNRGDLDQMISHATKFVKNFTDFKQSYGLLVTKVANFNSFGRFVKDEEIVEGTIGYLQDYVNEVKSDLGSGNAEEDEAILKKIFFVENLLNPAGEEDTCPCKLNAKNNTIPNIWFIRNPMGCGPLSESDIMVEIKHKITDLYENNMKYETVKENAFGFTVKAETREKITEYVAEINTNISRAISLLAAEMNDHYIADFHRTDSNLTTRYNKLSKDFQTLNDAINEILNLEPHDQNPVPVSENLNRFWVSVVLSLPLKFQKMMKTQQSYLEFFDKAADKRYKRDIDEWMKPVQNLLSIIQNYRSWYKFCMDVEKKVYAYEFHESKPSPPTSGTVDWLDYIQQNQNKIIPVSEETKSAANVIQKDDLNRLDAIMKFSLQQNQITCFATKKTVIVEGNFVRLSEVFPEIPKLIQKCGTIYEVDVNAAHTLFLDSSLARNDIDVVLLAPYWENPKSAWSVNMVGKNGIPPNPLTANNGEDGALYFSSNDIAPTKGSDACAGKAGGPGAGFFGSTSNINSKYSIAIKTSGGNGGPGQTGGTGGHGGYRDAEFGTFCSILPCKFRDTEDYVLTKTNQAISWLHCGIRGQHGADGGNGGSGGIGGLPGKNNVVQFDSSTKFEQLSNRGSDGAAGLGGSGGHGGPVGKGYFCVNNQRDSLHSANCTWPDGLAERNGKSGKNGASGTSRPSSCNESPATPRNNIEEWRSILKYRTTFYNQSHPSTIEFIQKLDTRTIMDTYVTLKGLAEESFAIASIQITESTSLRLRYLYSQLVGKLQRYYLTHFSSANKQHQKIMSMLLTSSLSGLSSLRTTMGLSVIVDVSSYLEIVIRQIETIEVIQHRDAINKTIQAEKTKFQQQMNKKIEHSISFIEEILIPAVNEAEKEAQKQVDNLGDELDKLLQEANASLQDAKRQLRKAEAERRMSWFFKLFSIISDFVTVLKPSPEAEIFDKMVKRLEEKYAGSKDKVEMLRELVAESKKIIKDLEDRRDDLRENFVPLVDSLMEYIGNISKSLAAGEDIIAPELAVTKWQVVGKIKEAKNSLGVLADEVLDARPLLNAFERLQDAMTVIVDIYETVDHYMETKGLAEYIAVMQSALLGPVEITDPEYKHLVADFDKTLKQNLLEVEVKKAVHAFKQWVFPFAKFYLAPGLRTSTALKLKSSNETGISQLQEVKRLKFEIDRYKSMSVGDHDTFIKLTNFSSGLRSSEPFFVWGGDKWRNEIKQLLSGKTAYFDADVMLQGKKGWDAIKFRQIEINLKLNDPTPDGFQEELDDLLDYFGMSMTHSGISSYRFIDEFYMMTGANQTLVYNYERDGSGNRLGTNMVYQKFKSGDFLLSPYTVWGLQLFTSPPIRKIARKDVGFEDLQKFLPYLDLELVGMGTYVDGPAALSAAGGDLQLEKFYDRDLRRRIRVEF